ncbi:MAG: hypothetical protein ACPGKS_08340 [Coraliomargarita sp.]
MSEFLVPGLDALLYILSFFILAKVLTIAVKIISKGDANTKFMNGFLVVIGMIILKASFELRIDSMAPGQTVPVQLAIIYAATFTGTVFLVFWRFATPLLDSSIAAVLMVAISYGHGIGMPMLSERVLPEGKTFAEFMNLANDKTQEQKQIVEDLKNSGALEALAAANKGKEAPSLREAFGAIADLTEEKEFNMLKNEFATGMEVIAERIAIMEAMSPEERESYKAEMAAFMAEQGLSNNPYNLKALKTVKSQDVQDMAAFMESMQGTMGMAAMGDGAPDSDAPSLSSSLMRIAQNIKQTELTERDKKALSTFSSLIRKASMDEAIEKAKAEVQASKGKDPIASTMLAALLETKAEMPISDFIEQELGGGTAVAASDHSGEASGDLAALEVEPAVELLAIPITRGVVRIPDTEESWERYLAAATAVPIQGFVLARGDDEVSKVVLGTKAVAKRSKWRMEHEGRTYIFQVDDVSTGMAYLTAMY